MSSPGAILIGREETAMRFWSESPDPSIVYTPAGRFPDTVKAQIERPRFAMLNSLGKVVMVVVVLIAAVSASPASRVVVRASGQREVLPACEAALQKRTFEDATVAGLNPPAMPVSFDSRKAVTTRRNGKLIVAGTEDYRPAIDVPAFPVRYECVADPATGKVDSITYTAVGANGASAAKAPVVLVREAQVVRACRSKMWEKVADKAIGQGLTAGGAEVELEAEGASLTPASSRTTIEVAGRGQIRLSQDYEWQPVAFTCRYDEKKKEATRASYTIDRTSATRTPALSPDKAHALEACHAAVEGEVLRDAQRRGYRLLSRVQVDLKPGAAFKEVGQDLEVKGRGEYKLDDRHKQPTPLTFTCVYDARGGAVRSAAFEAGQASWTPSGEIATGKTATLVCESTRDVQRVCPAPIKGNVRIIRQRSSTPCEAYKNWIWSSSGITVWGGCQAEFEFETR